MNVKFIIKVLIHWNYEEKMLLLNIYQKKQLKKQHILQINKKNLLNEKYNEKIKCNNIWKRI